ncbi:hypothetical protein WICPIJ_004480, partial [Wickerhamomyces pijperi]
MRQKSCMSKKPEHQRKLQLITDSLVAVEEPSELVLVTVEVIKEVSVNVTTETQLGTEMTEAFGGGILAQIVLTTVLVKAEAEVAEVVSVIVVTVAQEATLEATEELETEATEELETGATEELETEPDSTHLTSRTVVVSVIVVTVAQETALEAAEEAETEDPLGWISELFGSTVVKLEIEEPTAELETEPDSTHLTSTTVVASRGARDWSNRGARDETRFNTLDFKNSGSIDNVGVTSGLTSRVGQSRSRSGGGGLSDSGNSSTRSNTGSSRGAGDRSSRGARDWSNRGAGDRSSRGARDRRSRGARDGTRFNTLDFNNSGSIDNVGVTSGLTSRVGQSRSRSGGGGLSDSGNKEEDPETAEEITEAEVVATIQSVSTVVKLVTDLVVPVTLPFLSTNSTVEVCSMVTFLVVTEEQETVEEDGTNDDLVKELATEEDEEPLADTKLEAGAMVLKVDDSTEAEEETAGCDDVVLFTGFEDDEDEETLEDGLTIEVESLTEAELDSLW